VTRNEVDELLNDLAERGITLRVDDLGRLQAKPKGKLTDSERQRCREACAALIAILRPDEETIKPLPRKVKLSVGR
jgi:hypothetical protein